MKAFRDPVHNIIYFDKDKDKLLLDLIDTKEFQRLRQIRQLGFSSFTYPGATHTRFAHSIGVTHLMKRFLDKILNLKDEHAEQYKNEIKNQRMLALTSALLHDIGHGPFSHAIEPITNINHEDFTTAIISGNTDIHKLLESYKVGFSKEVISVIKRTHPTEAIVKLLSSQLDTDRIDYLHRDSLMTGVGYGFFDLEWLIHVLRIGEYNGNLEIGLDLEKGLSIAEDFIMARYYMYKHVYFHKTTRSAEVMVGSILKRALELYDEGQLKLENGLELFALTRNKRHITIEEYLPHFLKLTDHTLWHYISVWRSHRDPVLSELCNHLLSRKLYKSFPIELYQDLDNMRKVIEIEKKEKIDSQYIVTKDTPSTSYYKDSYITQKAKETETTSEKEASEHIILFDNNGIGHELSNVSEIVERIRNRKLNIARAYSPLKYKDCLLGGM